MSRTSIELLPVVTALPVILVRAESPKSLSQLTDVPLSTSHNAVKSLVIDSPDHHANESLVTDPPSLSWAKSLLIIGTVSSMVLMNSMLTGVLTVGLPAIAHDVALKESLLLWPASVFALSCGCTLLLSGSVADVLGSRSMYLTGCVLLMVFTIGCGLSRTGIQLIVFRALSGVAMSFCLPSAVSIITTTFSTGQRRNIAFACLGASQPAGFSLGLVLGGVLIDSVGWRVGYYVVAGANVFIIVTAIWGLPRDPRKVAPITWRRLLLEIDWIGAGLASTSLGLLSYVFATVTSSASRLIEPANLTLFCISIALIPAFIFWVNRQERLDRPAIIPNSLWRTNRVFTCTCISVFFCWSVFNAFQYFMTLYFQTVQGLTAIEASVKFLPMVISGALTNVATGLLVHRVRADTLVIVSAVLSSFPGLLMAIASPNWSYWSGPFIGLLLAPIAADTLFTISNLVITSVFPSKMQGLAGGVFNTISMIGNSVGLAITAVIAGEVSKHDVGGGHSRQEELLEGYKASFWTCFAASVFVVVVTTWGLRSIGKVGLKRE